MPVDLLIAGGEVIDPAQGLHARLDVAVQDGRVAAVGRDLPAGDAAARLDARGLLVTPGLIDLHTHVAESIVPVALPPDEAGVLSGVTCVVDAGSTGYANLEGLLRWVVPGARTDVFCFVHLCPVGEAVLPEIGWEQVSADKLRSAVAAHPGAVKGVKLRLTGTLVRAMGLEALVTAKRVAAGAGLPVVVHLGLDAGESLPEEEMQAFTARALGLLGRGDLLTHAFTAKPGGVFRGDGSPLPALLDALERGIVLDVAAALGHLDFEIARGAIERGFLPTTLSTDFTAPLFQAPVPMTLAVVMSEFLALGLSLDQVVERATALPAAVLGEQERRGSLRPGMLADLTLFELAEGEFLFVEGRTGRRLTGDRLLVPRMAVKGGVPVETGPRARSYAATMERLARQAQGG